MAYNFNEIRLDKGMYSEAGKSFEQVLEGLDPNENYKGTPYEGMDAFQRQLKRFDIKVRGAGSDVVEKFFSTSESAVLFPEYVSRSVKAGMEEGNILPSITASVTRFEGMAYRSMTDGLVHLLRREAMSKGVSITYHDDNSISIELHIIVENGVNIATVCRSIMSEVKYVVTKNTGVEVREINVCVDSVTV